MTIDEGCGGNAHGGCGAVGKARCCMGYGNKAEGVMYLRFQKMCRCCGLNYKVPECGLASEGRKLWCARGVLIELY